MPTRHRATFVRLRRPGRRCTVPRPPFPSLARRCNHSAVRGWRESAAPLLGRLPQPLEGPPFAHEVGKERFKYYSCVYVDDRGLCSV